jgi:hypothetical protein
MGASIIPDYEDYEDIGGKTDKPFVIDSDKLAEWAIGKIREDEAEFDRLITCCMDQIDMYNFRILDYRKKKIEKTAFLRSKLREYFDQVKKRKTKTMEVYELPTGSLKLKKRGPQITYNEEALVKYLEDFYGGQHVKTIKKPEWGEFKKEHISTVADGTTAIDINTGEVLEFVTVTPRDPEFVIE